MQEIKSNDGVAAVRLGEKPAGDRGEAPFDGGPVAMPTVGHRFTTGAPHPIDPAGGEQPMVEGAVARRLLA